MIILVTGTPGAGKSLYNVSQLLNGQFKDRPLYVNNIPNLLLEHEVFSGDGDNPPEDSDVFHWFDGRVKTGGVICIDEAQRIFRPRSATAAVPEYISKLEVHRHFGIDIILITQHPQLIHANVRRLVGRHIHVRRAWGMKAAVVYEWDSCSTNVQAVKNAQTKIWRYDKSAYKLYKSSEMHTKAGGRIPFIIKLAMILLVVLPFVWWHTFSRVKKQFNPDTHRAKVESIDQNPSVGFPSGQNQFSEDRPMTADEYRETLKPRIKYLQHTASRYDELTQPVRVPVPAACIKMKKRCECFTQDGTPYKTSEKLCTYLVEKSIFLDFNPEPAQEQAANGSTGNQFLLSQSKVKKEPIHLMPSN